MPRRKGSLNKKTIARLHAEGKLPVVGEGSAFRLAKQEMQAGEPVQELPSPASPSEVPAPLFVEYLAPSGDKWRIEQGTALLEFFDLSTESIAAWHGAIAPEERVWRILRWHFGIAPLLAGPADAEFLAPISLARIAERLAIQESDVSAEIESAKAFWSRYQLSNRSEITSVPPAELPRMEPTEQQALLTVHGFSDLSDKDEILYVTGRINDLKHKLEDEEGRTIAQRCIRVELRMRRNDAIMAKLEREAADPKTESNRAGALRSDINGYHGIGGDLSGEHLTLMKAMNATQEQNPSVRTKVAFVDCLGQVVRAIQEYESRGDTTLIDGIFAAAEVKILTTPMSLRPPQYRLDIVMVIRDAMKHENLWNPEYEPPAMDRAMYRRWRGALASALAAAENDTGTVVEMEDDETDLGPGLDGDAVAQIPAVNITALEPASTPITPVGVLVKGRSDRRGDEFVSA